MFLTKNKLKKKKNVDDGIEYLNYMKHSHLDVPVVRSTSATLQGNVPEVKDTSIQTNIGTFDKGVETLDELNALKGAYRVILEEAKAFPHRKVDKQVQVFTEMLDRTKPKIKTPPSSDSNDKDYPMLDTLATVGYYTGKGLYHTGRLGLKATGKMIDYATRGREEDDEESNEEEEVEPTTTFLPSNRARQRSRSRDDETTNEPASSSNAPPPNNNMASRFLRRGASRSRSSTPKGGYPRKKK